MLDLVEVTAGYGGVPVLHGISLRVEPQEVVALIGANGVGKTTTLRTISGLVRPSAGCVTFRGEALHSLPPQDVVRRGVVHVPEGRRIFPLLTVEENLEMGAFTRRPPGGVATGLRRVYEYFPRLAERRGQLGGTLSGGEQQMLAIARGLMGDPALLLLDEPTLGLSPILVEQIAAIVQEIRRRGIPILLVEQNAAVALELADRGYVIESGRVAVEGPAAELARNELVQRVYLGVA